MADPKKKSSGKEREDSDEDIPAAEFLLDALATALEDSPGEDEAKLGSEEETQDSEKLYDQDTDDLIGEAAASVTLRRPDVVLRKGLEDILIVSARAEKALLVLEVLEKEGLKNVGHAVVTLATLENDEETLLKIRGTYEALVKGIASCFSDRDYFRDLIANEVERRGRDETAEFIAYCFVNYWAKKKLQKEGVTPPSIERAIEGLSEEEAIEHMKSELNTISPDMGILPRKDLVAFMAHVLKTPIHVLKQDEIFSSYLTEAISLTRKTRDLDYLPQVFITFSDLLKNGHRLKEPDENTPKWLVGLREKIFEGQQSMGVKREDAIRKLDSYPENSLKNNKNTDTIPFDREEGTDAMENLSDTFTDVEAAFQHLYKYRIENEIGLKSVADAMGEKHPSNVKRYETGGRKPTVEMLRRYSNALDNPFGEPVVGFL